MSSKAMLQDVEAQEEDPETKRWRDMERTLITRIAQGTAGASIVLNLVAMIFEAGSTIAMGLIGLFVGSCVIYFQYALQDSDSLRVVQNDLRHKVNDFAELNVKLRANSDRLEGQLEPLKESETKLKEIAEKNGTDVDKLKNLVKDNQVTLDAMNATLKRDILQDMMEAVLDAEGDNDGKFSDTEIKKLALKLGNVTRIDLDKDKFIKKAKLHRNMSDLLHIIKTIDDDGLSEEERVFTIRETAYAEYEC